ncbi:unnamed protein product [Clonostachys chloroleuca]|uniref:EthD domain-containing protein n=1 Tax=Clonostachys chloroleuca TaxID=1926264 RepID=A0AA35MBE6_9HYPO|nr:unnamed protein product [Clonostachys chloroleuca]
MAAVSGDRATSHQRIDHKFNFELFDYDTPENFQPCIKLEFFFYKLPDVSSEHFHKHYAHIHSDITVAARSFGAHKVQRYTQLHQTPEMKARAKALGLDVFDYDGCSAKPSSHRRNTHRYRQTVPISWIPAGGSRSWQGMRELIAFGKAIPDVDSTDGITEYFK